MKNTLFNNTRICAFFATLPLLFTGCARENSDSAPTLAQQPLAVRTIAATEADFEELLTVQGSLEAVNSAVIAARTSGHIVELYADVGDEVESGTRLCLVDPERAQNEVLIARDGVATAQAQVAVAEANVVKVEATVRKSRLDAERFERMGREGYASSNELERATLALETAEADQAVARATLALCKQDVEQAKTRLAICERSLADTLIASPIRGRVQKRLHERGEQMAVGTPVFEICDGSELKAMAYLPAKYFGRIEAGKTKVRISASGKNLGEFAVVAKSPAVNPRLRTFEIKALLPGSAVAFPGAMVDVSVLLEKRTSLAVPEDAVLQRAAGTMVFVIDSATGSANTRPVETGLRTGGKVEIISGLNAGDCVVTEGQSQLYDGRPICVVE